MNTFCRLLTLLATLGFAQSAIIISNLSPKSGSTMSTDGGALTVSVNVRETTRNAIRHVVIDLRANGKRQYRPLRLMRRVSGTIRYEYDVDDLEEGVRYCFRVRAKNRKNRQKWSPFSCFTIEDGTSTPTGTPSLPPTSAPSSFPSQSPTPAPSLMPSFVPTISSSPTSTPMPTSSPTSSPSSVPSSIPTDIPTALPTNEITPSPTMGVTYGLQPDCFVKDRSKFSICLDLASASGEVEPFMSYFVDARKKWESVVVSNGLYYARTDRLSTEYTATGSYPSVIDGIYIASYVASVDGAGGILGSAGPVYTFKRNGLRRPITGVMNFDIDDLEWLEEEGMLEGVIQHEMGHVMGIGSLWQTNRLVNYPRGNLYFGANVLREWVSQGCELKGSGAPIVEMDGGSGTAGGHFDERCFDEELMTGYADQGIVLSNLTIGSLADMGYEVDYSLSEEFDLTGPCCSRRRRLGGASATQKFSRRRLSPENEEKAVNYGKGELKKLQQNLHAFGIDPDVAIVDTISVYVEQDGHVIDVEVHVDSDVFDHIDETP